MDLGKDGWALVPGVLAEREIDDLVGILQPLIDANGTPAGVRNLLDLPAVCQLARCESVRSLVEPILGQDAIAVRGILFDKTPGANWKVPWHQDLTIAVREQRDVPGYTAWTEKAGVPHVQPPPEILQSMLNLRIHLDTCGEENGPLQVLPGSHRDGKLTSEGLASWIANVPAVACLVEKGDVLAFRPLLLHSSSPARSPVHRRVLQLEFANRLLPDDVAWNWAV